MSKLTDLRKIHGLKDAREWLGMSLSDIAQHIKPSGNRQQTHVTRQMIAAWQRGSRTMSRAQLDQVSALIAEELTYLARRRTVGVKITVNSPWRVTAWGECKDCREWFEIPTIRAARCPKCRTRAQRAQARRAKSAR
jgi:hypothetical protein